MFTDYVQDGRRKVPFCRIDSVRDVLVPDLLTVLSIKHNGVNLEQNCFSLVAS